MHAPIALINVCYGLLPRTFAYNGKPDGSTNDPPPQSCWHEPTEGVIRYSTNTPEKELPLFNAKYLRCYPLPSAIALRAMPVASRPYLDETARELGALNATIASMETAN